MIATCVDTSRFKIAPAKTEPLPLWTTGRTSVLSIQNPSDWRRGACGIVPAHASHAIDPRDVTGPHWKLSCAVKIVTALLLHSTSWCHDRAPTTSHSSLKKQKNTDGVPPADTFHATCKSCAPFSSEPRRDRNRPPHYIGAPVALLGSKTTNKAPPCSRKYPLFIQLTPTLQQHSRFGSKLQLFFFFCFFRPEMLLHARPLFFETRLPQSGSLS